jgi:hypothetical protein
MAIARLFGIHLYSSSGVRIGNGRRLFRFTCFADFFLIPSAEGSFGCDSRNPGEATLGIIVGGVAHK